MDVGSIAIGATVANGPRPQRCRVHANKACSLSDGIEGPDESDVSGFDAFSFEPSVYGRAPTDSRIRCHVIVDPYADSMAKQGAIPETMKPLGSYVAKRCPRRVQLDIVKPVEQLEPAADAQMRMEAGVVFEDAITEHLRAVAEPDWAFIPKGKPYEEIAATTEALSGRAAVIVNARLPNDTEEWRSGAPDVLVWATDGYVPIDVKHHKTFSDGEGIVVSDLVNPRPSGSHASDHKLRDNKDDALQLAHYWRMLEGLDLAATSPMGGIIGKEGVVAWYDLDEPMWTTPAKSDNKKRKKRTTMEAYDFEFGIRRSWAADAHLLASGESSELLPPVRVSECGSCGWKRHCDETLEAGEGDASLLPGIGYRPWRLLRDDGVETRADVAALDYRTAQLGRNGVDLPKWLDLAAESDQNAAVADMNRRSKKQVATLEGAGIWTAGDVLQAIDRTTARFDGAGFLPEAILNARAATGDEPVYLRPGVEPMIPRADIELDIDMENTEDGVYLWGVLVTDRVGSGLVEDGFLPFCSFDPLNEDAEMSVFRELWSFLNSISAQAAVTGVSLKSYCWHESAENTQLRRIARRDAALLAEVEAFIDSGTWVDLEKTFKTQWITGGSTGLKAVAPLAEFTWDVDDPGGGMSMVRYLEAVAGSQEAQEWLLTYNRGDVEATKSIRDWLDQAGGSCSVVGV